jgi:hypothetical protein
VVNTFRKTVAAHGIPPPCLSDNGLVYTTRFAQGGRHTAATAFPTRTAQTRRDPEKIRPNHPTTLRKVETLQQTLKKWLRAQQPSPPPSPKLKTLLHQFTDHYNTKTPHRSLGRRTP